MKSKTSRLSLLTLTLLSLVAFLSITPTGQVQAAISLPAGFITETVVAGLTYPTTIAFAPDGRIFIGQKSGIVRVFENGTLLPVPFINISSQVNNYWDRGLLGVAIHPNFPDTPYVYLLYTYDPPGAPDNGSGSRNSRLMRVSADPNNTNIALAGSEVILMGANSTMASIGDIASTTNVNLPSCFDSATNTHIQDCLPSDSPSHSIGTVTFGLDGSLFVGNGDGAHFNFVDKRALRSLELDSMAGKIFRIDPITGRGLPNNPFYDGNPDSNRSKIYNLGLRNPFRFTIHPTTGLPYIGDVGWNTWEEVNTGIGKNFGWPCYEGNNTGNSAEQPSYKNNSATQAICATLYQQGAGAVTAPLYAYDHAITSSSVQVGSFYTANIYPEEYHGALFLSDYNRDTIGYLTFAPGGEASYHLFASDISSGGPVQTIVGPDTNLYYVAYNPGSNSSTIQRIRYIASGNNSPVALAKATPNQGDIPLTVEFTNQSYDPDANTLTYHWDFGDGASATNASPSHQYASSGIYTVTLTVTDTAGASAATQLAVYAGNHAPTANMISPGENATYSVGDTIYLSGAGEDPEEGALTGEHLQWSVMLHHFEHVHFDYYNTAGASGSFEAPDHGDNTSIEVCLTVTDSGGLSDTQCRDLVPNLSTYTFETVPAGLELAYEGSAGNTPFTVTTILNSIAGVDAPEQQNCFRFVRWSDDAPRSREITIDATPRTYTAIYTGDLPGKWQSADIGVIARAGGACATGATFQLRGSGNGTTGSTDQFHFVYQSLTGDGGMLAQIVSNTPTVANARSGIMIRSDLQDDAPFVMLTKGTSNQLAFSYRPTASASSIPISSTPVGPDPLWVRILRNGNVFSASYSFDGVSWNTLPEITIDMPAQAVAGVLTTSQDTALTNIAEIASPAIIRQLFVPYH